MKKIKKEILKESMKIKVDVRLVLGKKVDSSFLLNQLLIDGFT